MVITVGRMDLNVPRRGLSECMTFYISGASLLAGVAAGEFV